jgi:acyl carrier protein
MQKSELYAQLTEIFREVFMEDDLRLEPGFTSKDIPGWDSFRQIEIILAIERRYQVHFSTRDLDSWQRVEDIASAVMGKLVSHPSR